MRKQTKMISNSRIIGGNTLTLTICKRFSHEWEVILSRYRGPLYVSSPGTAVGVRQVRLRLRGHGIQH
ncbi:Uncharacterised protein [Klebsiella oxytoca]|nr:hypothetical protein HMPREF9685_05362 [Klebsiella oxytoca 09-7231]SAP70988.1 Uncharacterised protein [Klebsiella oxytoca]SAQ03918.1 Uncharacterised protein [Klebsiella oxytoca]